jgi:hypothetical protein
VVGTDRVPLFTGRLGAVPGGGCQLLVIEAEGASSGRARVGLAGAARWSSIAGRRSH